MSRLGESLKKLRLKKGYRSARRFYQWLSSFEDLEFNYSYYLQIENGDKLPSSKVVHTLARVVEKEEGEVLVSSFCIDQFPQHAHLFESPKGMTLQTVPVKSRNSAPKPQHLTGQKTLTERQVSVLAKRPENYFLFLIMTMSRREVQVEELQHYFKPSVLKQSLQDLQEVKLLIHDADTIQSTAKEYRFPAPDTQSLKQLYKTLDLYDSQKTEQLKLQRVRKGEFLRRISPRYLELILSQIEVLFQTLRISDEADVRHNQKVVSLSVKLEETELPG